MRQKRVGKNSDFNIETCMTKEGRENNAYTLNWHNLNKI